uniref:Homologous recombination OB-fold protein OB-fold domain-containing protein n=1 Tax=Globisporangium ultimum (strain ATCC 200006 / CBS 805.95 / DAOM BR144) TaxID=431595 RepID=K3WMI9_GLOUD
MVFASDKDDDEHGACAPEATAVDVYSAYNEFYDEEQKENDEARDFADERSGSAFARGFESSDDDDERVTHKVVFSPKKSISIANSKRHKRAGEQDDDDFESQQSILKWVRTVPGPLQDVMKNQANLESEFSGQFASGGSNASVMITTVFDDGPWVDICDFLGISTVPGRLYGGIKMSSLKHTLSYILEDDQSSPKIPQLLLLIKSMKYVDEEIVAVLHDPTGEIEGYFHRDIVEQLGPALGAGTGVLLRKVSVFTPTDATSSVGRRKSFLNIVPRNLQRVFLPKSQLSSYAATVDVYNKERAALVEVENTNDENRRVQEEEEQRLLQHDALRNASTELSFLSQRQVVHRHPPARTDAANPPVEKSKGKKSKKKAEDSSGLGKWQWNQLAKRKPSSSTNASSSATTMTSSTADRDDAASRGLPMSRRADEGETAGNVDTQTPTRVRFAASPVVLEIPPSHAPATTTDQSGEEDDVFENEDPTPRPVVVAARVRDDRLRKSQTEGVGQRGKPVSAKQEIETLGDEDDDDW